MNVLLFLVAAQTDGCAYLHELADNIDVYVYECIVSRCAIMYHYSPT